MSDEEWIKTLPDGRKVKFSYQELLEDGAFITAQLEGNEVVYSIILTKAGNPLSRENVERRFQASCQRRKSRHLSSCKALFERSRIKQILQNL
jgi:hypothetical protein